LPINGGKSVVGGVVDGVVAVVVEGETEGLVDADGSVIKAGIQQEQLQSRSGYRKKRPR
jgi:hypothetical protein